MRSQRSPPDVRRDENQWCLALWKTAAWRPVIIALPLLGLAEAAAIVPLCLPP